MGNSGGVKIGLGNRFYSTQNIYLDNYIHIGNDNYFYADARITVSEGTVVSDSCEFRTANHYYDGDDLRMLPYDERVICEPITFEKNCWIGTHVIVLPGVTIHEGAVVGAGSVVSKDVPPYAVVCGNPAKVVKYRNSNIYQKLDSEQQQIMRVFDSYKRTKIMKETKNND